MSGFFGNIKGDKAIWGVVALLALFSFLPVYSASSNLVYVVGNGTTIGHLVKHGMLLILGFGIIYGVHKIPTHFFKGLSIIALPVVLVLLVYTLAQGTTIEGANASRWIRLPLVGITFQTSNLAAVVLMIYVARYLSKIKDTISQLGYGIATKKSIFPVSGMTCASCVARVERSLRGRGGGGVGPPSPVPAEPRGHRPPGLLDGGRLPRRGHGHALGQ